MIANMLMEGRARFDEIVASVNPTAQEVLRSKEQFVVNYFREVWNIDFYSLQTRVQGALNALVPSAPVQESYGFDKIYTTASVNPENQTLLPQRQNFMSIYNSSATAVSEIPGFGLTLDSMAVIFEAADSAILRMYIQQDGVSFSADFVHHVSVNGNVNDYTYVREDENAQVIHDAVVPLLDYFANNQFTLSWYIDPAITIYPRIKFAPVASPTNYFLALLLP